MRCMDLGVFHDVAATEEIAQTGCCWFASVLHSLSELSSGSYLFSLQHVLSDRWLICSNKASSMWF